MTCPVCGKAYPCVHARSNTSVLAERLIDREVIAGEPPSSSQRPSAGGLAIDEAWRREVVSRVQQHRARRRRPADPNALELDFSTEAPHNFGMETQDGYVPPPPDRFHEIVIQGSMVKPTMGRPAPPKVIRFPRTQPAYVPTVEEVTLEELERAAPEPEAPRIMEAYEDAYEPETAVVIEPDEIEPLMRPSLEGQQMELLPSFSDIRLEADESRLTKELEAIPHPAPLQQRFVSGLADAGIVFAATGAFALTFAELAEEMPQSRMTLVCMLAAAGIFWLLFQYVFLVYRRATPGMNIAQLEICTFEGKRTTMFDRQCRAAASALSGFSVGLGYAWALVDEDRLGWHDRISRTHLRALSVVPSKAREPYSYDDRKG